MANVNMNGTEVLNGSGGYVWVNTDELANVEKVSIKVTGSFEEVKCAGDFRTYHQYTGYSIAGTLTLHKVNSFIGNGFDSSQSYKTGKMPDYSITTALKNPVTGKQERAKITGVKFTEFSLADFEAKALAKEEIPFVATDYEWIEKIS